MFVTLNELDFLCITHSLYTISIETNNYYKLISNVCHLLK